MDLHRALSHFHAKLVSGGVFDGLAEIAAIGFRVQDGTSPNSAYVVSKAGVDGVGEISRRNILVISGTDEALREFLNGSKNPQAMFLASEVQFSGNLTHAQYLWPAFS